MFERVSLRIHVTWVHTRTAYRIVLDGTVAGNDVAPSGLGPPGELELRQHRVAFYDKDSQRPERLAVNILCGNCRDFS